MLISIIDITERKRITNQIRASLKEKEILLQEIHHRVKNNLQVISSLLNLQADSIHPANALEMLHESRHRIKTMALVHEKLYSSTNLHQIDFADYIDNLGSYLLRAYQNQHNPISLKIDTANILLEVDVAIPCGLIVNELISNAFKHAFPPESRGIIEITLKSKGDNLVLRVKDNGIGFPQALNFKETESLGLQLVTTLVNQLEGTIEMNNQEGTEFIITF